MLINRLRLDAITVLFIVAIDPLIDNLRIVCNVAAAYAFAALGCTGEH